MIDKKLVSQVQDLKENKNLSITKIAKLTGRGRTTIYKVLKEELNYIPYNRLVKQNHNVNQEPVNEGKELDWEVLDFDNIDNINLSRVLQS